MIRVSATRETNAMCIFMSLFHVKQKDFQDDRVWDGTTLTDTAVPDGVVPLTTTGVTSCLSQGFCVARNGCAIEMTVGTLMVIGCNGPFVKVAAVSTGVVVIVSTGMFGTRIRGADPYVASVDSTVEVLGVDRTAVEVLGDDRSVVGVLVLVLVSTIRMLPGLALVLPAALLVLGSKVRTLCMAVWCVFVVPVAVVLAVVAASV